MAIGGTTGDRTFMTSFLCYHRRDAQQSRGDDYDRLGCVLPSPFNKGETWYDMAFEIMQKDRWRSTLAVWIKKLESTWLYRYLYMSPKIEV
jgi:hypothetical protein